MDTYEKKYKEIVGQIKKAYLYAQTDSTKAVLEEIFPELKESEDERIKEAIIATIHLYYGEPLEDEAKEMLAWLEKQGEKQPIIVWHSINEEPEEMKELFCEWESDDATWHDVAFYDEVSHTFYHAKMPINVTKWIYVDELLEKQCEQKPALNEKDEQHIDSLLKRLDGLCRNEFERTRFAISEDRDWLTSLKERIE